MKPKSELAIGLVATNTHIDPSKSTVSIVAEPIDGPFKRIDPMVSVTFPTHWHLAH